MQDQGTWAAMLAMDPAAGQAAPGVQSRCGPTIGHIYWARMGIGSISCLCGGKGLGKGASVGNDLGSVDAIGTRAALRECIY